MFTLRKASGCQVTLTVQQLQRARWVAKAIHDRCRAEGKPDGHGARGTVTADDEEGGHAGELAVSLLLGVPWTGAEGGPDAPDVGERTQVRTLTRPGSRCLLVRPHDIRKYGDVPFVLIRREDDGRTFTALGWCLGSEVPYRGRLTDGGNPTRPPVWLVHPACLRPMRALENP